MDYNSPQYEHLNSDSSTLFHYRIHRIFLGRIEMACTQKIGLHDDK